MPIHSLILHTNAYGVLLVLSVNLGNFFNDVVELLSDLVHRACTKITLIIMVDEKTISVSNDHHLHAGIMFKNNNDASMMRCCFLDEFFKTCWNIKCKYKG